MTIKQPFVSIILPTYNGKHERLSQAIDSVIDQTYINRELIIINDASANDVENAILEYVQKDKRIRYYKNEKNLKLPKSLNKWIHLSKWNYIARIDDDDIWCDTKKLEKQVNFMERNLDYGLAWTDVEFIDEQWKNIVKAFEERWEKSDKQIRKKILSVTQLNHQTVLMRRTILDQVWWYNWSLSYFEDHELWLRIWTISKLYQFGEKMVKYRINTQWMSRWLSYSKKVQRNLQNLWIYFIYLKDYPNKIRWLVSSLILFMPDVLIQIFVKIWKKLWL